MMGVRGTTRTEPDSSMAIAHAHSLTKTSSPSRRNGVTSTVIDPPVATCWSLIGHTAPVVGLLAQTDTTAPG